MLFIAFAAAAIAAPDLAPFGRPAGDAELAAAAPWLGSPPVAAMEDLRLYGLRYLLAGEVVDQWWAEDGAALITEAVRPKPALPAGFDLARAALGAIPLRLGVAATTP